MKPHRSVLAPDLERWSRAAPADARRTAVVRIGSSTDAQRAAQQLSEFGAGVQSTGAAVIVCLVTPGVLRRVAREPWVLAVEEPRRLFPTSP